LQFLAGVGIAMVGMMLGLSEKGIDGLSEMLGLALMLPNMAVASRRLMT
jgi:hypothetical protein